MNTVELNSINLQSIDVASNNVSSIGKSIKRNKGVTLLPAEYQQVEYIESTGTQYIDTGVNADNKMGIEIKLLYTSGRFGAYQSSPKTMYHLYDNGRFGIGATNSQYGTIHNAGDIYIINCNFYNDLEYKENGIKTNNFPTNIFDANLNFWLFKRNPSDSFVGRIYYTKITVEDKIVRDFIPCYRKSDNEIGMYDVVNDVFYTNNGTGTFLKGADVSDKEYSTPYIKGHITTNDSTFTFSVDGKQKTVSVDANGDFKFKVKKVITSLSFVGVPQLESLELFAIDGVTSFDVDYPVSVSYLRCDSTTKNAKNDVYHIRGTATDNFSFTIRYLDDGTSTLRYVTEDAVIDENGKFDVVYKGRKIGNLLANTQTGTFYNNSYITRLEITENFDKCTRLSTDAGGSACGFRNIVNMTELSLPNATFEKLTVEYQMFRNNTKLTRLYMPKAKMEKLTSVTNMFLYDSSLSELIVPNNSSFPINLDIQQCPLTYDSMLRVAGWLKDLTGQERKTVTFKQSAYNKPLTPEEESTLTPEQQSALIAERQANLLGIIEDTKNWILATA